MIDFFLLWGHTQLGSGVTPGRAGRDHVRCRGSNLVRSMQNFYLYSQFWPQIIIRLLKKKVEGWREYKVLA